MAASSWRRRHSHIHNFMNGGSMSPVLPTRAPIRAINVRRTYRPPSVIAVYSHYSAQWRLPPRPPACRAVRNGWPESHLSLRYSVADFKQRMYPLFWIISSVSSVLKRKLNCTNSSPNDITPVPARYWLPAYWWPGKVTSPIPPR